jgi:hypothetical protein
MLKKWQIIAVAAFSLLYGVVLYSCTPSNNREARNATDKGMVTIVSYEVRNGGTGFMIFELEGHKYLKVSDGVLHLESCKCKNKE